MPSILGMKVSVKRAMRMVLIGRDFAKVATKPITGDKRRLIQPGYKIPCKCGGIERSRVLMDSLNRAYRLVVPDLEEEMYASRCRSWGPFRNSRMGGFGAERSASDRFRHAEPGEYGSGQLGLHIQ